MEKIQIISKQDGLSLDVLICPAVGEIHGIVQISHGMAEHKERYIPFMEFLSNHGYTSVIHDHRGHGRSVKAVDDLGYFYEKKADMIVEDLQQVTILIKERFPDVPLILFGHSMGSLVARKYLKKYDSSIERLIVCGSPSKNPLAGIGLFVSNVIQLFHGDHYRSGFLQRMAFGSFDKKVGASFGSDAWICSDTEAVQMYHDDPLCGFTFTVNGFQNLFHLIQDIYSMDGWALKQPRLPILFLAGSDDPVIGNKKKWMESQKFLQKLGYQNIQNIFYQGMRHELLNETIAPTVYQDILKWIDSSHSEK